MSVDLRWWKKDSVVGIRIGIILASVDSIVAADQVDEQKGLLILYRMHVLVFYSVVGIPSACFIAAVVYAAKYHGDHVDDKPRQWDGQCAPKRAFSAPDQVVMVYTAMQEVL